MNPRREQILLVGICGVLVLLSLGGLVFGFTAGLFYPQMDMDGLLLLLVALSMGGVFTLVMLWLMHDLGWLEPLKARLRRKAKAPAAAAEKENAAQPQAAASSNPGREGREQ